MFYPLNQLFMYYVRKYTDCWAIHNDKNGQSRKLTEQEVQAVRKELPELTDPKVRTVYADRIESIPEKP